MYHRHKFNAVRTELDGIKFGSKKEARYYSDLKLRKKSGEVVFFLMQVPFNLPGNTKYRLDFMEFHSNGEIKFIEVKGMDLPMGKLKRKQTEALYPVKIDVI